MMVQFYNQYDRSLSTVLTEVTLNPDDDMPDAPESADESPAETTDEQEPAEEVSTAIDKLSSNEEVKEHVTSVGGRRRGRRKVTKKKTMKDDEGYLGMFDTMIWKHPHYPIWSDMINHQLLSRNPLGNRSPKMILHHQNEQHHQLPRRSPSKSKVIVVRARKSTSRDKVASCPSFPRSEGAIMELDTQLLLTHALETNSSLEVCNYYVTM